MQYLIEWSKSLESYSTTLRRAKDDLQAEISPSRRPPIKEAKDEISPPLKPMKEAKDFTGLMAIKEGK